MSRKPDKTIGTMYGKHYESMYKGSMIGSGAVVFAVMGYVISNVKPPEFQVELNPDLLAFILGETPEDVKSAIEKLCSPDPKSRSKLEEGRRLLKQGEYAYKVVNGKTYHDIRSEAEKQAYWRDQKRRQREQVAGPEEAVEAAPEFPHGTVLKAPNGKVEKPVTPNQRVFTDGWCAGFLERFGSEYSFNGGRDGKASAALVSGGASVSELLQLAKTGWNSRSSYIQSKCINIHGFLECLNQVKAEHSGKLSKPHVAPGRRGPNLG